MSFQRTQNDGWGYETFMNTPNYHIISGKSGLEKLTYSVEKNNDSIIDKFYSSIKQAPEMRRGTVRVPIASEKYPPHAGRFDNINKTPSCHSAVKNKMTLKFQQQTSRDLRKTLLPERPYQTDYDQYTKVKEKLMFNLTSGSIDMSKQLNPRPLKKSTYREELPSSINSNNVARAQADKIGGKKKSLNFT